MADPARTISIITPVNPSASDFLIDAHASIAAQELPEGWSIEWLVHVDGGTSLDCLHGVVDERISVTSHPEQLGPAVGRNLLLARAAGRYLKVLDADDQLAPGVLGREIAVIEARPDVVWVTSSAHDLHRDGRLEARGESPPDGELARGSLFAQWLADDAHLSVHPATLFARTDAVRRLGGWMALPGSEDTALMLCLDALHAGWFTGEVGLFYRKWSKQLTAQASHEDEGLRTARGVAIRQRVELLG